MFEPKITRSLFLKQFLVGLSATLVLSACTAPESNTPATETTTTVKTLKVATEPSFPPFESKGTGGELVGFDIDLIKAVGQSGGFTIEFESLPFDGMIPGLQANTIDAAISAISITPERGQTIAFSQPYFKAGLAIAVRQDNTTITSLETLQNQKIAAQIGTTGAKTAKSVKGAQVREFDSAPLALQELVNGNVDAVVNDAPVTLDAINTGKVKGVKVVGQLITEEFYGIALPKNSPHLQAINNALTEIIDNGTYAQIYKKWFDAEPPQLPKTIPAQ
ncbi:basic amino acid ABC transporter substrate-binding protein [Nodularia sp. LEGE 06071]|nr:basic amino acid ABC transporter substrate-binding protein [Nodularia sp. LEGE 06071]MCC2692472.1 basic amino acid ABC transporter substrate-binding protein [Nodularia sp. LEGE 04288]